MGPLRLSVRNVILSVLHTDLTWQSRWVGWGPHNSLILFFQHKFKKGADVISPKFRWNLTDTFRTKDTNVANQVYLSLLSTLAIARLMQPHIHSHVHGSLEPVRHTLSHRSRGSRLVARARACVSVCVWGCVCCVYVGVRGGTVGLYQQEPNFTCHPLSLTLPVFML